MKPRASKIAVSLPSDLLEEVERARAELGESRSQFVRGALVGRLRDRRRREDIERYLDAYREEPESEVDAWSAAASAAALAGDPWG